MNYLIPPWNHQLKAIERATAPGVRDFALLFDMGTGKTSTTINILRHRFAENGRILRTLILCPVAVCDNWPREFAMHSKVGAHVKVLKGSEKKRIADFQSGGAIFVTNFEALQMKGLLQAILQWGVEVFVVDESQRIKNPQAVRTKMSILIADQAKHRYILSGTPILNKPLDIWSQYRVLDKGESFKDSLGNPLNFYAFRGRYFTDDNAGMPAHRHFPKWTTNAGTNDDLHHIIYRKAMRVMKSECLDLPDLVTVPVYVELGDEQKKLYDQMKRDFIAFLKSGEAIVASIALTKALRLQQLVSGFAKTESDVEVQLKSNPRLTALEDLIVDLVPTQKVIVWATFAHNYKMIAEICERLELPYAELHGQMKGDRQAEIDRFNNDPECRVMIANQQAGGVGVNLTASSAAIFYSKNFSLEQDLQARARNYRGGSEIHQKVTHYDLIATGTIDEIINTALADKMSTAEQILAVRKLSE